MTDMQRIDPHSPSERAALRKAIAERDNAKERVRVTSEASDRGKKLLRDTEAKLGLFGDVDAAILAHRASSYKASAQSGSKPSLALPEELIRRERARDEASAAVAAARAAHGSLVGEFAEAQGALRNAESKVSKLAGQVLAAETAKRGLALADTWNDLWATVDSLQGLSSSGVPLPREVLRTLQSFDAMDHRQHPGGRNERLARAVSFWKAYRRALCKSAVATGPEPIDGDLLSAAERAA